jgi:hypothetical protein
MWCFQHSNCEPITPKKQRRCSNQQNKQRRFCWTLMKNPKQGLKVKISIPTTWPRDRNADFYFSVGSFSMVGNMEKLLVFVDDLRKRGDLFQNHLNIDDVLGATMFFKK